MRAFTAFHTHDITRQPHYGSSSSFKSWWKRTAYIADENVALLKCGRRGTVSSKHIQSLLTLTVKDNGQEYWILLKAGKPHTSL